jgi:hypothetical protein
MSRQTAIEWYIEESEKMLVQFYDGLITSNDLSDKKQELLTQAKQMEREQIEDAFKHGFKHRDSYGWEGEVQWTDEAHFIENETKFNQYFTETYGKEESPS